MELELKQLSNNQLIEFDKDDMYAERWAMITHCIDRDFPEGKFSFLDLGGGNGLFTDKILAHYPLVTAVVIDNAKVLLEKNKPHPNKTTILASADEINQVLANQKFDIIFMNWLLHHLVADTYSRTRFNVVSILNACTKHLTNQGKISVFENLSNGLVIDSIPSHIIFHLTSSKKFAPLTKKLGANTAGIGVCYRSHQQWLDVFKDSGLKPSYSQHEQTPWYISTFHKMALIAIHCRPLTANLFWLERH